MTATEDFEMTELPFAATAPVSVSRIGLKARNADTLAEYYKTVVGLADLSRDSGTIVLGVGGRPLVEITNDPAALPDDPRSAGLFHTAFLLPSREHLAAWIRHARDNGIRLDGASDHLVSEALYLSDPEGNGIEIYADRPHEQWSWTDGQIEMATIPLDLRALLEFAEENGLTWNGAPDGTVIGHVHLRVGDPAEAEAWWTGEMGFDTMTRYGDAAVFLATGGYHHHIGANSWRSAGAGPRDPKRAGLSFVELVSQSAGAPTTRRDPWGTEIRTVAAA